MTLQLINQGMEKTQTKWASHEYIFKLKSFRADMFGFTLFQPNIPIGVKSSLRLIHASKIMLRYYNCFIMFYLISLLSQVTSFGGVPG